MTTLPHHQVGATLPTLPNSMTGQENEDKPVCQARDGELICGTLTTTGNSWCTRHHRRFSRLVGSYKNFEKHLKLNPYEVVNETVNCDSLNVQDILSEFSKTYRAYLLRKKVGQLGYMNVDEGHQYRCDILLQYMEILHDEMGKREMAQVEVEYVTYDYVETADIITEIPKPHRTVVSKIRNQTFQPYELNEEKLQYKVLYEACNARIKLLTERLDPFLFRTVYSMHWYLTYPDTIQKCMTTEGYTMKTMELDGILSITKHTHIYVLQRIHNILDAIEREYRCSITLLDLQKNGLHYLNNIYTRKDYVISGCIQISDTVNQLSQIQQAACEIDFYTGLEKGYDSIHFSRLPLTDLDPEDPKTAKILKYFADRPDVDPTNSATSTPVVVKYVNILSVVEQGKTKYIAARLDNYTLPSCWPKNLFLINLDQLAAKKSIRFNKVKVETAINERNRKHMCTVILYTDKLTPQPCDFTSIRELIWERQDYIADKQAKQRAADKSNKSKANGTRNTKGRK